MIIRSGNIVPKKNVDVYKLGMKKEDVVRLIGQEYSKELRGSHTTVLSIENAMFFFSEKERLYQIGVTHGFDGKFDGKIGVGNTLKDILGSYGGYYDDGDVYLIQGIDGISFELEDTDDESDWNELEMPIEWIWVYDMTIRDQDSERGSESERLKQKLE